MNIRAILIAFSAVSVSAFAMGSPPPGAYACTARGMTNGIGRFKAFSGGYKTTEDLAREAALNRCNSDSGTLPGTCTIVSCSRNSMVDAHRWDEMLPSQPHGYDITRD